MIFFNKQLPQNDAAQLDVARLLRQVTPPEKTLAEWMFLENRLMADLAEAAQKPLPAHRLIFSYRPVLATVCALLLFVAGVFMVQKNTTSIIAASPNARLIFVEGAVESASLNASAPWHKVRALEPFSAGHKYRVPQTGMLRILLDGKSVIELSPGSRLMVLKANTQAVLLQLEAGEVLLSVGKRAPDQSFAVITRNARCEVVGTRFKVQTNDIGTPHTTLSVMEGAVSFHELSGQDAALVRAGESAVLSGERLSLTSPITDPAAFQGEFDAMLAFTPAEGPTGLLSVLSDPPGADVLLNNVLAGHTPLSLERSAGVYTLTLRHDGFAETHRTLEIAPNRPQVARASLEKIKYLAFLKRLIEKETEMSAPPAPAPAAVSKDENQTLAFDALQLAAAEEEMQSGAFGKALSLLNNLDANATLPAYTHQRVLENIARCYRGKGDYRAYAGALENLLVSVKNPVKRDNLLWETAVIKATFLGRYDAARTDLLTYIATFNNGIWIQEAYLELAEVNYLLNKPADAANTYRDFIRRFPESPSFDKAVYNLAYLYSHSLADCAEACQWYNRLENNFQNSAYLEDALFWKADCYDKMGQAARARDAYNNYIKRYPGGRWKSAASERLSQLAVNAPPQKG